MTEAREGAAMEEWLDETLRGCGDVESTTVLQRGAGGEEEAWPLKIYYCGGMIERNTLQSMLGHSGGLMIDPERNPLVSSFDPGADAAKLFDHLFAGRIVVWKRDSGEFYYIDIPDSPGRSPEESTMEVSLKGPRDGLVEQIDVNAALIRKRLRTPKLQMEWFTVGTVSQTEVGLLYMKGIAPPLVVDEARRRLRGLNISALHGAAELEEVLSDRSLALFPLINFVGRPDFAAQSLMNGRFAILVDGSPAALIAPANLAMLIKSPEDAHLPFYYVAFERLLRLLGLFLSVCLPGFWIALSAFNTDQIPLPLLATVTISRIGLPLGSQLELFLMMLMFELFREAGVRLPRAVGQTVTVVGGLIVGDAAIRAGLTSPTMLVVSAVTAVATFTLVNQSLNGTVTVIRLYIMLVSSFLGLFGFFVSLFSILLYLCTLESFGVPYLRPVSPFRPRKLASALLQLPWKIRAKRGG